MAGKVQCHLQFPVRKSTRKTKSVRTIYTLEDSGNNSTLKGYTFRAVLVMNAAVFSSSYNWKIPETKRNQSDVLALTSAEGKSPCKRKTSSIITPLTPPKSPCKSVELNSSCFKSPSYLKLGKKLDEAQVMDRVFPVRLCHDLRSPSKLIESISPPATPCKSPIKLADYVLALQDSAPLPVTPIKTSVRQQFQSEKPFPRSIVHSSKKGLQKGNEENFVLKSPKKPSLYSQVTKQDYHLYQVVKQSLHTSKPDHLVGRDQEVAKITRFLETHLDEQSPGSLYISGAPGTGKTATLLHIVDELKVKYKCKVAYLNCMTVKDVSGVFKRLYSELSGKSAVGRSSMKDMEKLVTTSRHNMVLILDEIDQLDSKNQEILYNIFEWPSFDDSKLILVGVANALDLTDRILPRLQAKPSCRPKLLHFAPYTHDQITTIIKDRLAQVGDTVLESSAIQFCARKVSAVAGDMRKALDVCRRAVELAESEIRDQTVLKITDCNSPSKLETIAFKKIGVAHISKVMMDVYGSSVQVQQSEGVPLQQKLLVCTLLLVVKTGKFKEVLLGKLHETYCKVCQHQQMTPVDQSEFHSLCVLLEARGVISIKKAKETRLLKITLRQDEKELEQTLKDRILVSSILKQGLPK